MRRVLYLDLVGGAAGDMLLAALLDIGASRDHVIAAWRAVGLANAELRTIEVRSAGLRALRADVLIEGKLADAVEAEPEPGSIQILRVVREHEHRPYRVIRDLLGQGVALEPRARQLALDAFHRLAVAEGAVHGVAIDDVEFHEVGSDDALADIVGVATAIADLGVEEIVVSPVPLGRGLTRGGHGPIPLPGPATLSLLTDVPIEGTTLSGETVTPTGAALLRAIATRFGAAPKMTLDAVGVGAGHRSWPDRPNIVRALLGHSVGGLEARTDEDCVVEANIDDMSPEHLGALKRALFKGGALDVWSIPIAMKKDRMGMLVAALVRRNLAEVTATTFFTHSTTLGVRLTDVARVKSERRMEEVETSFGKVRIKVAERPEGPPLIAPEYDDCERLAEASSVSIRTVMEAALRAAWAKRGQ